MIKSFKNVCTKNSVWDAGDNEDVGKGSTKPEIEFEHALAVILNACLVCICFVKPPLSRRRSAYVVGMEVTSAPEPTKKRFPELPSRIKSRRLLADSPAVSFWCPRFPQKSR